jgi:hypothetical protein
MNFTGLLQESSSFLKKKPKNFFPLRTLPASPRQQFKSFLVLFFKKERLAFLLAPTLPPSPPTRYSPTIGALAPYHKGPEACVLR